MSNIPENAGFEHDGPSKSRGINARHENAGHAIIAGHEIAGYKNADRVKMQDMKMQN